MSINKPPTNPTHQPQAQHTLPLPMLPHRVLAHRMLAHRLVQMREKMSALRQEEEKIRNNLSHGVSQFLVDAGALEIDFDILVGGVLDVITEAKANLNSPNQSERTCPERNRKVERWQKAGQMFHRSKGQKRSGVKKEVAKIGGANE